MQKELNPELFGEKRRQLQNFEGVPSQVTTEVPFLDVDRQLSELRQQVHQCRDEVQKSVQGQQELQKNSFLKIEKLQQAVTKIEQNHNGLAQEAAHKISQLNIKLNEQNQLMAKMQEMADRHNQIVKSFEVRMNQLQNILNQKEAALVQTQAALSKAKEEIARMLKFS